MMDLYLIRHGQSTGNLVAKDTPDGELTELGRQQALTVMEGLKTAGIEYIITSPLIRAIETAQPLAQTMNLQVEVWKELYEVRDKGAYTGPTAYELQKRYPEVVCGDDIEVDGWYCPGDETEAAAGRRANKVMKLLYHRFRGRRVALFAHSGFNRQLLLATLHLPSEQTVYFQQTNSTIFWITMHDDKTVLNYIGAPRTFYPNESVKKRKLG